jgi:hypothetical protein
MAGEIITDFIDGAKNLKKETGINYYKGLGDEETPPILDPKFGAQQGFRHNVFDSTGKIISLNSDSKHLSGQVIPMLMQVPKGFNLFKDQTKSLIESLRVIVEERPDSITGLKGSLIAEFVETDVGGAGEKASQIANMTRERSEPTFTWRDIIGTPIQKLLTLWMEFLLMDPDTKIPKVNTLEDYVLDTWTKDYQSMTVMFMELDQSGMYVHRSWLITDMMPTTNGTIEGRRNLMEAAVPLDLEILFTGVSVMGHSIDAMATKILHGMSYVRTDTQLVNSAFEQAVHVTTNGIEKVGFDSRAKVAKDQTKEFGKTVPTWKTTKNYGG